ncbi:hypothetical protein V6000_006246 [Aspergillus fumigatus]
MFIPLTQGMSPIETRLFINNEYVYSRAQMSIAVCNPTDGSTITADLQVAGGEDINAVVAAATSAFRTGPWGSFSGHQRARCLLRLADLIEKSCGLSSHNWEPLQWASQRRA